MTEIITIAMQKGGVGKTTTTINLAAALAEQEKKVLVIDLDPQGNLTEHAGFNPEGVSPTIYNAFQDEIDGIDPNIESAIYKSAEGFYVLPSQPEMSLIELSLMNTLSRERVLEMIIEPITHLFDYVLIDCSPSLGLLVINALTASNSVLIPVQTEFLAARGARMILNTINTVKRSRLNPDLRVAGIALTMANTRTNITREVQMAIQAQMGSEHRIFDAVISRSVRFAESAAMGQSILAYAPNSAGAESYRLLAKELMEALDGT